MLKRAHAYAVKEKLFDDIVQFLRQNLDPSIEKIEMVNIEGESRFFVSSIGQNNSIDITKYGEGLQRIFEITMLMIFCRNGIICIDEVDSAIHKSLLIKFTEFIQKLADKCNVQVFLSTHSKECIDAFIENEYHNERITAYSLVEKEGKIVCKYIEGTRLEKLVDSINLDIR
ncbi:MAG TPA: hypothetical protein DCP28_33620 [Cytophagales bacterium]|nr:hypothetical protein [Cytophagales bacterium]